MDFISPFGIVHKMRLFFSFLLLKGNNYTLYEQQKPFNPPCPDIIWTCCHWRVTVVGSELVNSIQLLHFDCQKTTFNRNFIFFFMVLYTNLTKQFCNCDKNFLFIFYSYRIFSEKLNKNTLIHRNLHWW